MALFSVVLTSVECLFCIHLCDKQLSEVAMSSERSTVKNTKSAGNNYILDHSEEQPSST